MSTEVAQSIVGFTYRRRKWIDRLMCVGLAAATLLALVPLFSVLIYVTTRGLPGLSLEFFSQLPKPVGETGGGMGNAVLGTLTLILIGSFVGIGWGISTGIFLSEYGNNKTGWVVRFAADMLSSVPSIVIGLFVYAVVVVPMRGFSALAGGLALGIIMIPIVARSTEELLKLVPTHIREAGLALGLPRWRVTLWIVIRGSIGAIVTGVMLAIARVAGETAPLLFTALNNRFWQSGSSLGVMEPIASIPVQIYTYAISPFSAWHAQAWAGALVLVSVVFVINLTVRFWLRRGK